VRQLPQARGRDALKDLAGLSSALLAIDSLVRPVFDPTVSRLSAIVLVSVLMSLAARDAGAQGDWAPPDTVITMVRDGCERRCPVYRVVIFFHLADDFGYKGKGCTSAGNSDGSNVITTIVTAGHGKSIVHHHGCLGTIPDQLTALENEIDKTAQTAKWLKPALRRPVR
jgi:hypothetical protein